MGIGTSKGAFYTDEGHYNSSMWDNRYDDNIVSPQELQDRKDYAPPTIKVSDDGFDKWKRQYAPNDSGQDYDLMGAYKAGVVPDVNGHMPDTFKLPNHPTFSNESKYYKDSPSSAGSWKGEEFTPPTMVHPISNTDNERAPFGTMAPIEIPEGSLQGRGFSISPKDETPGKTLFSTKAGDITDKDISTGVDIGLTVGPLSFIGVRSPMFDRKRAYEAINMDFKGATPEAIWEATKTFRGADGKVRQELSNKEMKLKDEVFDREIQTRGEHAKNSTNSLYDDKLSLKSDYGFNFKDWKNPGEDLQLKDVIDHPELFKAYPELEKVLIDRVSPLAFGAKGAFLGDMNMIQISKMTEKEMKSVLGHEVQHWIQKKEGFESGGNTEVFKTDRWRELNEEFNTFRNKFTNENIGEGKFFKDFPAMWDTEQAVSSLARRNKYLETDPKLENIHDWAGDWTKYDEKQFILKVQPLIEKLKGEPEILKAISKIKEGERIQNQYDSALYDSYKRISGEVEARNVQHRMDTETDLPPFRTEDVPRELQTNSPFTVMPGSGGTTGIR